MPFPISTITNLFASPTRNVRQSLHQFAPTPSVLNALSRNVSSEGFLKQSIQDRIPATIKGPDLSTTNDDFAPFAFERQLANSTPEEIEQLAVSQRFAALEAQLRFPIQTEAEFLTRTADETRTAQRRQAITNGILTNITANTGVGLERERRNEARLTLLRSSTSTKDYLLRLRKLQGI